MRVPTLEPGELGLVLVAVTYVGLPLTSGVVVKGLLSWADADYLAGVSEADRDIGLIVGKAENVLLLTLVLAGAYTGIAVVFAAKSLVRQEKIENDDLYYFAGTFVNVAYSVLVGAALVATLELAGLGDTLAVLAAGS